MIFFTHAHTHICTQNVPIHTQTHTCTHGNPHTHTCTHSTHTHTCTHTLVRTHTNMHTCTHRHMHTQTHAHTLTHVQTHTHTHAHIHTYTHTSQRVKRRWKTKWQISHKPLLPFRLLATCLALHCFSMCWTSLIPRPHPLTRRNHLVNQVEFLGLVHAFCDNQRSKHFVANPLKKGSDAQMEMNKFYCCKESAT